jgi:hypothetical protein
MIGGRGGSPPACISGRTGGVAWPSCARFVTDAVADALTRLERTRWIEVRTPEARDAAWQEHSDILDAVQQGDADRAAELVAAHVAGTNDRLLGFIAQERRRLRGAGMAIVGAPERLAAGA